MIGKRQMRVLDFINSYYARNGYAPKLKDIRNYLKVASVSTAHFHVAKLIQAGYLQKQKNGTLCTVTNSDMIVAQNRAGYAATCINNDKPERAIPPPIRGKRTSLPLNKIIHGDAITELGKLPAESCDVIIADPPYNIGKDFGNNSDSRTMDEYINWSMSWIAETMRVLKPSGTMFIYGFSEILAHLSVRIKINKRWLIWHYTNKNVASVNFWQRSHEAIICAWKGNPVFNRDDIREPYTYGFLNGAAGKKRRATPGRFSNGKVETTYNAHHNGALPRDVIKAPALAGGAGMVERWFLCKSCDQVCSPGKLKEHSGHDIVKHPTQKPMELSRRLILSAMPKKGEGTVLVPFAGSGSECAVAKKAGYSYIGFEINSDYVKIARRLTSTTRSIPRLL